MKTECLFKVDAKFANGVTAAAEIVSFLAVVQEDPLPYQKRYQDVVSFLLHGSAALPPPCFSVLVLPRGDRAQAVVQMGFGYERIE